LNIKPPQVGGFAPPITTQKLTAVATKQTLMDPRKIRHYMMEVFPRLNPMCWWYSNRQKYVL